MSPPLTRRAFLGAGLGVGAIGAAALAVETDVLPGRPEFRRALGLNGPDGAIPTDAPGQVISGSLISDRRGGVKTGWAVAYPPGDRTDLPLVLSLHMLGGDHRTAFDTSMRVDRFLPAAVVDGVPPFAIATVDGGRSYWHERPSGEDAGAMVTDEFLPVLVEQRFNTDQIGLLGWSMGGFGALRLGGLYGAGRVTAISVAAPAIWVNESDASQSGFDSPDEYDEVSVFGRTASLRGIPLRIDCGRGDPFLGGVEAYADQLDAAGVDAVVKIQRGGHDRGFWRRVLPDQLAFLGRHLG